MKKNKGITLVALIITIIVMLILVTVTVSILINSNVIGTAKSAGERTKTAYGNESNFGESLTINVDGSLYNSIDEYLGTTPGGTVEPGTKVATKTAYTSGSKTAQIPAGFTISGKSGETSIDTGLVIYYIDDKSDAEIGAIDWTNSTTTENLRTTYDQFVWIPIDDANDMFMCQSSGATGADNKTECNIELVNNVPTCTVHNSTAMAGRLLAGWDSEEEWVTFNSSQTAQTYSNFPNENYPIREPATLTAEYDIDSTKEPALTTLQPEYNSSVKSVIENKGFWVGRYETSGMNGSTISVVAGTTTGISNVDWYAMYNTQKAYATNKGLLGGMISGAAYDQVIKFIGNPSVGRVEHRFNAPYATGNTNYPTKVYEWDYDEEDYVEIPNATPTAYNDISKNIYDLEGNVGEWTTEAYYTNVRVYRGGYYSDGNPASLRDRNYPTDTYGSFGSRAALYVQ